MREEGCDPSGALVMNIACQPDGQKIMGALIGMTLGAAGIPQLSLAIEALTDARGACYPAIGVMDRVVGQEVEKSDERSSAKTRKVTCSTLSEGLPKYEIDSSSSEGILASSLSFGEICLKNVSFAYPSRPESLVLDSFSISLKPGSTIGIVGPSGCGKSTLVSLLEHFYDPESGEITINGINIKDINLSSLRQEIGVVSQEPKLFATTIRNNIAYGNPSATLDEIKDAAKQANAHSFIERLPNGYETLVGDRGSQLSGGERQRIALARVLVRERKLLLLDEFSSALDSESEMIIEEALEKILHKERDMTTVIVAHRLSTVQSADCIVVMCDGGIVECGNHEQLLQKRGLYHKLVQDQSTTGHHSKDKQSEDNKFQSIFNENLITENGSSTHVSSLPPQIRFHNVHFHYPARPDIEILRGLNLTVRKGETLALVGESGGGKSTVISLLERYYDVTSGTVEFSGINVKELNVRWLRDQFGMVSQEPTLFDTSIRENLLLGCSNASQAELEEACRLANAHDFICKFPLGYDTIVGEGGSQLISGGQKQRICIARAILKNRSVLLLDEASSSLDSRSEKLVQEALHNIMKTKSQTTIVIAHRLGTIKNSDRIAVIAEGVVKEIGTWDQLMSKENGHFRRMSLFQSLDGPKSSLTNSTMVKIQPETDESEREKGTFEQESSLEPISDSVRMSNSKRARLFAKEDVGLLVVGSVGALLAGVGFPTTGVLFGYLIELLYRCDAPGFPSCSSIADDMQTTSFYITFAWIGVLVCTSVGNVLLYFGFGTASEKMNQRVRNALFQSLLRQEVAYFDKRNVNSITSQLQDDASILHAFSGEPLRTFIIALSSFLVGILLALYYMWPVALVALGLLPVLAFGAKAKVKNLTGNRDDDKNKSNEISPDAIAIETLLNMRTVASLNIEQIKKEEYSEALKQYQPNTFQTCIKGSTGGVAQFCQFWGMALLYWFGGYLLSTYPDKWEFRDFLIAMFAIIVSISGTAMGSSGTTDKKVAMEAADRIFALIDRKSAIDPFSESGIVKEE